MRAAAAGTVSAGSRRRPGCEWPLLGARLGRGGRDLALRRTEEHAHHGAVMMRPRGIWAEKMSRAVSVRRSSSEPPAARAVGEKYLGGILAERGDGASSRRQGGPLPGREVESTGTSKTAKGQMMTLSQ